MSTHQLSIEDQLRELTAQHALLREQLEHERRQNEELRQMIEQICRVQELQQAKFDDASLDQADTQGYCYCYARVSHLDSAESRLGIDSQIRAFNDWWEYKGSKIPNLTRGSYGWQGGFVNKIKKHSRSARQKKLRARLGDARADGIFIDEAVSAYKKQFIVRPAGGILHSMLKPGDVIVFPRLDRGFRNTRDFANTYPQWVDRGISVVFIDPEIDMTSSFGKLQATMLVAFAQWESDLKSERTREALRERKLKMVKEGKIKVFGWVSDGTQPVPYWEERRAFSVILDLATSRLEAGKKARYEELSELLERLIAQQEGRPSRPDTNKTFYRKRDGRRWNACMVRYMPESKRRNTEYRGGIFYQYCKDPIPLTPEETHEHAVARAARYERARARSLPKRRRTEKP